MAVNYNFVPSQTVIDEANSQLTIFLSNNKWQLVGNNGAVYPVKESPVFQIDNQTGKLNYIHLYQVVTRWQSSEMF